MVDAYNLDFQCASLCACWCRVCIAHVLQSSPVVLLRCVALALFYACVASCIVFRTCDFPLFICFCAITVCLCVCVYALYVCICEYVAVERCLLYEVVVGSSANLAAHSLC